MATTVTQETTFVTASIKLRLATADDFRKEVYTEAGATALKKYVPKYGQPYWVKSMVSGEFDNWNYIVDENTDWPELRQYLAHKMVYVPARFYELSEANEL